MRTILLTVAFLFAINLFSQTSDNFEDGDFTANPPWSGTNDRFIVNSDNYLQLNDTEEATAYLSTPNDILSDAEWRIWVELKFSPSGNNNARYYLISDNDNVEEPLCGYFIQFGESGSDDAIEIFRQDRTDITSVCRGMDGAISTKFEAGIKVTRINGEWKLYVDYKGGIDYQLQAEGTDHTYNRNSFIGISCKYTKSYSEKMYFDNVYAGPVIIDNEPPQFISLQVTSDSTLQLYFDENLDSESAEVINNYVVDQSVGNPVSAFRDENDGTAINLIFNNKFVSGNNYTINISGVKDLSENTMLSTDTSFSYYLPQPFDVVINEIMIDPVPSVGLPEYEYLELYNTTSWPIDLDGWKLIIGSSEKDFIHKSIKPNGYLILAKETSFPEFYSYGDFYGFSSFSLTNSGQDIELISDHGIVISEISYSIEWYHDSEKEDGGWSVEQKNPENSCSGSHNWAASVNPDGGTPGFENSVLNYSVLLPEVSKIIIADSNSFIITYNQNMDLESIGNKEVYSVSDGIGNPDIVVIIENDPQKAELIFNDVFQKGYLYELTVDKKVLNCIQLEMKRDTVIWFGLPEKAEWNDIVINEILFNPWTNGEDYIEIFNRSNKIINLSEIILGSVKRSPPNPPDTSYYNIHSDQFLFIPDEFITLTKSPDAVKKQYYTSNTDAFIRMQSMPGLNNDEGFVFIISQENDFIDSLEYSEEMQYPLLNYYDGVALERINPEVAGNDKNNWHSASDRVGFGTPSYINSQFVSTHDTISHEVILYPEIFSPDNDGYDDVINVNYSFSKPGNVMSVMIYNSDGYPVKDLINNEYLGTSGSVSWDGITDYNTKGNTGIYIFLITVYDINGNVRKYKKTGVLATKL